jgi:hypothetical protein
VLGRVLFLFSTVSVSTATTTLPTVGSAVIDVVGFNLGLVSSAISVVYTGGSLGLMSRSHTVDQGACTVAAPGTYIKCPSQPGVGANYSLSVVVDGGASAASAAVLSYAPPIINSVDGPGALGCPTAGGVAVHLQGVR